MPSGFPKFLFRKFLMKIRKNLGCSFTHVKGLSIDPSGFSAPPLGLPAS